MKVSLCKPYWARAVDITMETSLFFLLCLVSTSWNKVGPAFESSIQ